MCKHKFFEVKKLAQNAQGSPSFRIDREGVLVVCLSCGEVVEIWEDGTIKIKIHGKEKEAGNSKSRVA